MTSYYNQIPGLIKYIALIDRDNSPIILLNLSEKEKELDFQLFIFSSLDLLENKERQKISKNTQDEYIGFLMPFYEFEFDLGTYAFVGNNGIKIITLKKLENNIQETSSEIKLRQVCKEIHSRFIKLLLNPFYDKKIFYQEKSQLRENFANTIIDLVKQYQII